MDFSYGEYGALSRGEIALSSRQVGSKVGCDLRLANGDGAQRVLEYFRRCRATPFYPTGWRRTLK